VDALVTNSVALLLAAVVVALLARRLQLPYTVGLVGFGTLLALTRTAGGFHLTHNLIFEVLLPALLFEAAINIHWRDLARDSVLVLVLAVAGTVISAIVVAAGMVLLLGWPVRPAVLFGVLIAATDPVAVISMFKDNGIGGRLRLLTESESLFNDGVAAVLFVVALAWVTAVAAYGSFLLAQHLGGSGVLATITAGLVIGNFGILASDDLSRISAPGREFALGLWEFIAFVANSVVFLLIGVAVARIPFGALGLSALAGCLGLVLLARAVAVYPLGWCFSRSRWKISWRERHVLWWGGLRGALGLALALSLPAGLPYHDEILVATFGVVCFSVVFQGLTMPLLLRRLGFLAEAAGT
jgi:CPA1 family monovalent cation:H+ antiporter